MELDQCNGVDGGGEGKAAGRGSRGWRPPGDGQEGAEQIRETAGGQGWRSCKGRH